MMKTAPLEKYEPKFKYQYENDVYLNYETLGSGRINIIFLHGFGVSLNAWNEIKDSLDIEIFKYYFIDLKGFGFSHKSKKGNYSIKEHSNILIRFIKEMKLDNLILVGHSYGGSISLNIIAYNKINCLNLDIKKMVLLDPAAYIEELPFFFKAIRNPITRFLSFKILGSSWNAKFSLKLQFYDANKITKKIINRYSYFFSLKYHDETMAQTALQAIPDNYQYMIEQYKDISISTLIIWGQNDKVFPVSLGHKLSKALKNSKLEIIKNCGHIPHEECPDITSGILTKFFME